MLAKIDKKQNGPEPVIGFLLVCIALALFIAGGSMGWGSFSTLQELMRQGVAGTEHYVIAGVAIAVSAGVFCVGIVALVFASDKL